MVLAHLLLVVTSGIGCIGLSDHLVQGLDVVLRDLDGDQHELALLRFLLKAQ